MAASSHPGEMQRLEALYACGILDTPPEDVFDDLVRLTQHACDVRVAVIALLDAEREWFKARAGLNTAQLPRESALSADAVDAGKLIVVPDTLADSRFANHPLVTSQPNIRFCAAAPIVTRAGHALGALCIMHPVSRELSEPQRNALVLLARQVAALLEMRSRSPQAQTPESAQQMLVSGEARFRLLAESLPQIVWVRLNNGSLDFINQQGLDYLGLSPAESATRRLPEDFMHPEDQPRMHSLWHQAMASGEGFEIEARLCRRDGVYRWSLIRAHAIRDAHGRVTRWMGTSTDVHEVKENNERNAFLLALSTELAGLSDPQELVCTAMLRLRDRLQTSRVTLAEADAGEAILLTQGEGGDSRIEVSTLPLEAFRALALQSGQGLVTAIADTRNDPRSSHLYRAWYERQGIGAIVSAPLLRGGALVALLSVISKVPRNWTASELELVKRVADIVWPAFEKARADRALSMSEERLRLAQGIARIGAWEWDPSSNHSFFSPESDELFGFSSGERYTFDEVVQRVDSRDAKEFRSAIESCRTGGSTEIEHRYLHPARGLRWIHTKAGLASHAGRPCIVGISIDITERKLAEDALREINQRKDEFLAMLAHELRNPLAPIRSAAQILRMHAKGNVKLEWARSVIERQARHLTRLVDDLLDVSRIVRGQIVLEKSVIDLNEVVHHAVETSRPLIRERGHQLSLQLPTAPVRLEGDLTRLAQVVANLLINAAKYTNEGGRIFLEAEQEADTAVLRVRDTGVGISQALLPHIFDLFTQGERTLDRSQGGLGIGLTLVKRIVEMHGGTVCASSAGPGQGSQFVVRLPTVNAPASAVHVEKRRESLPQQHLRILVVDDNIDAADSIAMLLSLDGHHVRSVHSAHEALETAVGFHPDVVLLDIGLPGMDGYEVARRLRTLPSNGRMQLVAVTGYGQQEDRDRTRAAGFDQHLVKPVEPDALNEVLSRVRGSGSVRH